MKLNLARVLIAVVFIMNVQAAISFLFWPARYTPSYELSGAIGEATLRGTGVLFLMWNVPYALALWHPARYRLALSLAVAMQAIGLVGETFIYLSLPGVHAVARGSIARFILFDGLGLLALLIAAWFGRASPGKGQDGMDSQGFASSPDQE